MVINGDLVEQGTLLVSANWDPLQVSPSAGGEHKEGLEESPRNAGVMPARPPAEVHHDKCGQLHRTAFSVWCASSLSTLGRGKKVCEKLRRTARAREGRENGEKFMEQSATSHHTRLFSMEETTWHDILSSEFLENGASVAIRRAAATRSRPMRISEPGTLSFFYRHSTLEGDQNGHPGTHFWGRRHGSDHAVAAVGG